MNTYNKREVSQKILSNFRKIRVLGVLLVVLGHSVNVYTDFWNVFTSERSSLILLNLGKYIYSFHMPLFFFMSGGVFSYCYFEKNKNKMYSVLFEKAKKLLIPFVFIGIFYMLPIRYFVGLDEIFKMSVLKFLIGIKTGHLWFLWALFNIFILMFILLKYDYRKMILPVYILNIISLKIPNYFMVANTLKFFLWFYIGFIFYLEKKIIYEKIKNQKSKINLLIKIIILLSLVTLAMIKYEFFLNGGALGKLIRYNLKNLIAFLLIIKYYLIFDIFSEKINEKSFENLDKLGFGIYLLHEPLIYLMISKINSLNWNPYICTAIYFGVSLFLSGAITILYVNRHSLIMSSKQL